MFVSLIIWDYYEVISNAEYYRIVQYFSCMVSNQCHIICCRSRLC